jgi:alanine racemase
MRSDHVLEPTRAVALMSSEALLGNYEAISQQVPGQLILPMIKADAYGHGAIQVAHRLIREPSLYAFGVATLEEGAELRKALDSKKTRARIIVFSGTTPFSLEKGQFCEKYHLTPTLTREEDWAVFYRESFQQRLSYEIKFNTGMNRLGMNPSFASQLARQLRSRPIVEHPSGIFTHLAVAEDPKEKLTLNQFAAFREIRSELSTVFPKAHFHIANSSGIWNQKQFGLEGLSDVVRPGLSLYGIAPWPGAPLRGLRPVMSFQAPVIAMRQLKPGDRVGYGGSFRFDQRSEFSGNVAILAAGYADGMKRALSNQGHVFLNGKFESVIGIVSMDLCAVSSVPKTKVGDWAEIFGPSVEPWSFAKEAGTIPYEILTSVSDRVERRWS